MKKNKVYLNDIFKTLNFLHPNGSTFEICCIEPKYRKLDLWGNEYAGGKKPIVAGWYNDHSLAVEIISKLDQRAEPKGIYITLNPCNPALMARANNRLKAGVGRTKDGEIEWLQNLLIDIDVDSKLPSGISSTSKEKDATITVAQSIWHDLKKCDWPDPLVGDSGNGGHLIYKIDLPNTAENVQLLKSVLAALDQKYSTESVKIDTQVSNPSRMTKAYGTTARKGDSTAERPHRRSNILHVPDDPKPVSIDLLKKLAAQFKEEIPAQNSSNASSVYNRLDIPAYLEHYHVQFIKKKPNGSSVLYILDRCLFNPEHKGGESAIGQTADGKLFYQCFHDSCKHNTWHDAREKISGNDPIFPAFGIKEIISQCTAVKSADNDDHQPDKWDRARELFPRIDFPWHILSAEIAESLQQLGRSHATSPVALPGAAIAIFSSLLGSTVSVSPKQSWQEPLIFWFCDIRPSGSGKTPAARALCSVLYDAQKKSDQEYNEHFKEWQAKKAKNREPTPPKARSYFITDLTLEGLRTQISDQGGIVIILDELSAFLSGQNQYKSKGSDRESWLCLWDGKPFRVVRAGESITVSGARVSIFGGIQPRVWQVIFGREKGFFLQDGTVYRFLPTFESDQIYELDAESWDEQNRNAWEETLTHAMEWSDEIIKGENWKTKELCLSSDAQDYFFNWRNQLTEQTPALPNALRGFIPKIVSYSLRLSGVLYCMKQFVSGRHPGLILTLDDIKKGIDAAMFYMGHIVDATRALCTQSDYLPDKTAEQAKHLARTLESLRDEVYSERLAVGHIQKRYNAELPPEKKIKSPRAMGTLLRQFSLTIPARKFRIKDKTGLSCLIWDGKTEDFLKRHQQRQHWQQHTDDVGFVVLPKEDPHQHSQHSVDNVEDQKSTSTRTKPGQSMDVADVDIVDVDSTDKGKWEIGTI